MGYISLRLLQKLAIDLKIYLLQNSFNIKRYATYNEAKILSQRYQKSLLNNIKYLEYLEKVTSDIGSPIKLYTYNSYKYYITFLDKKTRYLNTLLLRKKKDAVRVFEDYVRLANNNPSNKRVRSLLIDNGGEYTGERFQAVLSKYGI